MKRIGYQTLAVFATLAFAAVSNATTPAPNDVTFHLNVGTGLRTVAAVMVDHRGRRTFSDARTLTLE